MVGVLAGVLAAVFDGVVVLEEEGEEEEEDKQYNTYIAKSSSFSVCHRAYCSVVFVPVRVVLCLRLRLQRW